MDIHCCLAQPIIIILSTVATVALSGVNTWDGGCPNRCHNDPKQFCQQDTAVCMSCALICDDDSYVNQCQTSCQAYLAMSDVKNVWEGCAESCQYDIYYFCETFTSTCMECVNLCDTSTTYYEQDRCYSNCAGYMQMIAHTTLNPTTFIIRQSTSQSPSPIMSIPNALSQPTVADASSDDVIPVLPVSITLSICLVVVVVILWKLIPWLKGRGDRNRDLRNVGDEELQNMDGRYDSQQQNPEHQTEVRIHMNEDLNDEAEDQEHVQRSISPSLPYPEMETQIPPTESDITMKESELLEGGGAYRTNLPLLRDR